jgi:hypothetical protein
METRNQSYYFRKVSTIDVPYLQMIANQLKNGNQDHAPDPAGQEDPRFRLSII